MDVWGEVSGRTGFATDSVVTVHDHDGSEHSTPLPPYDPTHGEHPPSRRIDRALHSLGYAMNGKVTQEDDRLTFPVRRLCRMLVVTPDGRTFEHVSGSSEREILDALYEQIGCTAVNRVPLDDTTDVWLNDDGLGRHPVNAWATAVAHAYGHTHSALVGTAVFAGHDGDGATCSLTAQARRTVLALMEDT